MWRCNSLAFSYKNIKVMRCKTCPLYGCGSSKTAPINRSYVRIVSRRSEKAAAGQRMARCEFVRLVMSAQMVFPSTLCVYRHFSPSVSIYLFSTLALYYTKASLPLSLSATLPHIAVFSTIYPQAYLSTDTFPQVIHRLIHKAIL